MSGMQFLNCGQKLRFHHIISNRANHISRKETWYDIPQFSSFPFSSLVYRLKSALLEFSKAWKYFSDFNARVILCKKLGFCNVTGCEFGNWFLKIEKDKLFFFQFVKPNWNDHAKRLVLVHAASQKKYWEKQRKRHKMTENSVWMRWELWKI